MKKDIQKSRVEKHADGSQTVHLGTAVADPFKGDQLQKLIKDKVSAAVDELNWERKRKKSKRS